MKFHIRENTEDYINSTKFLQAKVEKTERNDNFPCIWYLKKYDENKTTTKIIIIDKIWENNYNKEETNDYSIISTIF